MTNTVFKKLDTFFFSSTIFILYTIILLGLNSWYIYLQMELNEYLSVNGLTQNNSTGNWVITSFSEADRMNELEFLASDLRRYISYFCLTFLVLSLILFFKKNSFGFSLYAFFFAYIIGKLLYSGALRSGFVYPTNFDFQFMFLELYAKPFFITLLVLQGIKWIVKHTQTLDFSRE